MFDFEEDAIRNAIRAFKKELTGGHLANGAEKLKQMSDGVTLDELASYVEKHSRDDKKGRRTEADRQIQLGSDPILNCFMRYVHNAPLGREPISLISPYAMQLIAQRFHLVLKRYDDAAKKEFIDYIKKILIKYGRLPTSAKTGQDVLAPIWKKSARQGNHALPSGFYQLFRREKPAEKKRPPQDNAISCELVYIDSNILTAFMFSANHHFYIGSLHIDPSSIAHIMFTRHHELKGGSVFRTMYMRRPENTPFLTAVMLMDGVTYGLPLSTDCIVVFLPESEHRELYGEFNKVDWFSETTAEPNSIIWRYVINGSLPEGRKKTGRDIKYLRDFPSFVHLVESPEFQGQLFNEPTRCLDSDSIKTLYKSAPTKAFRWPKRTNRKKPAT